MERGTAEPYTVTYTGYLLSNFTLRCLAKRNENIYSRRNLWTLFITAPSWRKPTGPAGEGASGARSREHGSGTKRMACEQTRSREESSETLTLSEKVTRNSMYLMIPRARNSSRGRTSQRKQSSGCWRPEVWPERTQGTEEPCRAGEALVSGSSW